jgi:hypothetical protein
MHPARSGECSHIPVDSHVQRFFDDPAHFASLASAAACDCVCLLVGWCLCVPVFLLSNRSPSLLVISSRAHRISHVSSLQAEEAHVSRVSPSSHLFISDNICLFSLSSAGCWSSQSHRASAQRSLARGALGAHSVLTSPRTRSSCTCSASPPQQRVALPLEPTASSELACTVTALATVHDVAIAHVESHIMLCMQAVNNCLLMCEHALTCCVMWWRWSRRGSSCSEPRE